MFFFKFSLVTHQMTLTTRIFDSILAINYLKIIDRIIFPMIVVQYTKLLNCIIS